MAEHIQVEDGWPPVGNGGNRLCVRACVCLSPCTCMLMHLSLYMHLWNPGEEILHQMIPKVLSP